MQPLSQYAAQSFGSGSYTYTPDLIILDEFVFIFVGGVAIVAVVVVVVEVVVVAVVLIVVAAVVVVDVTAVVVFIVVVVSVVVVGGGRQIMPPTVKLNSSDSLKGIAVGCPGLITFCTLVSYVAFTP